MLNVFQEVSGYQSSCVSVSHVIKNRIITVKKKNVGLKKKLILQSYFFTRLPLPLWVWVCFGSPHLILMSPLRTMVVDDSHSPSCSMAERLNQKHQHVLRLSFPKAWRFVPLCPICGCHLEPGSDPKRPCSPQQGPGSGAASFWYQRPNLLMMHERGLAAWSLYTIF